MKQIIIIILLSISFCSLKSQDLSKNNYPDKFENSKPILLKNNIAKETIYEFVSLKKNADSTKSKTIDYDKAGDIINVQNFYNNILTFNADYYYTSDKKLHQIIKESYSSKFYRIFEYEYDSLGNELREYNYNKDTTNIILNAKLYNSKNQISELYIKNNNDSIRLEKKYSYNDAGILVNIDEFNNKKEIMSTYTYIVDSTNNYTKAYYQSKENKNQNEEFVFDKLYRCIKIMGYALQPISYINDSDNTIYKREIKILPKVEEFEYNENGTLYLSTEKIDNKITKVRKHYYTTY